MKNSEKINEANFHIQTIGFLLEHLDLAEFSEEKLPELTDYFNRVGKIINRFSSDIFELSNGGESR